LVQVRLINTGVDDEEELRPSALKVENTFVKDEDIKPFVKGEPMDLDLSATLPRGTKVSQGVQTAYFFGESTRLVLGEMQLLRAISRMDGLTAEERATILSPCPHCPLFFPKRLLKSHSWAEHGGRR
jgi:hypothetical protein